MFLKLRRRIFGVGRLVRRSIRRAGNLYAAFVVAAYAAETWYKFQIHAMIIIRSKWFPADTTVHDSSERTFSARRFRFLRMPLSRFLGEIPYLLINNRRKTVLLQFPNILGMARISTRLFSNRRRLPHLILSDILTASDSARAAMSVRSSSPSG